MKIAAPVNENYAAVIVKIKAKEKLEGLDNLVGLSFFGYNALVSKDHEVGEMGVLFTAETQLSLSMASENNLHRHENLNKDKDNSKVGYLEDNRRVRALRLRGNKSNALFMPLESLSWTGIKVSDLQEGDTFDELKGKEICKKYVLKQKESKGQNQEKLEKTSRVDNKFMPQHFDTANYWKNKHLIKSDDFITVTQKLHGTSIRVGNTLVNRDLSLFSKALKKAGQKIKTQEYDYIFGSRKVVKDINNPNQKHYYAVDLWSEVGKSLEGILPEGFMLYGEIIGYVHDDTPIQTAYTYDVPSGEHRLYVYRMTYINPQGIQTDLSWDAIKQFCAQNGLKTVPEVWNGRHKSFKVDNFIDTQLVDTSSSALRLNNIKLVDEGVVIRKEGLTPVVLKAKSPIFLEFETKMLDKEITDIEEEQK